MIHGLDGPGASRFCWVARAAVLAVFAVGYAHAKDAGAEGGARDAAVSCETSASCGSPTPYCHPTLHACVECGSDRNCKAPLVCDGTTGHCRECLTDGDCSSEHPYCDTHAGACVECFTDANCGAPGLLCHSGLCGSCGDGICGVHERIDSVNVGFGPTDPSLVTCPQDCASACTAHDLGSKVGRNVLAGNFDHLHALFNSSCGDDAPEIVFTWTPPHAGTFVFGSSDPTTIVLGELMGGCDDVQLSNCLFLSPGTGSGLQFTNDDLEKRTFTLRQSATDVSTYSLDIMDEDTACEGGPCSPGGDMGKPGDAGPSSAAQALCLDNARARGDDLCSGTSCACSHCPQDYDDCAVIPGCADVFACMKSKACVGADCYISGACRTVIDTYGSLAGPAFRAASGLDSCSLSLGCGLPCNAGDAGASLDGGAPDGSLGRVCEPHITVACPCEAGADGTKVCSSDGSGFGVCSCAEAPLTPVDSNNCNCRLGAPAQGDASAAVAVGLGLALVARRRRRKGAVT
jgi:hypothetical protein